MASYASSNAIYIDATGDLLTKKNLKLLSVTVTATSATAVIVLQDITNTSFKLDLRVADAGSTQVFDYSTGPMMFPNGFKCLTLTNAIATLVYTTAGNGG